MSGSKRHSRSSGKRCNATRRACDSKPGRFERPIGAIYRRRGLKLARRCPHIIQNDKRPPMTEFLVYALVPIAIGAVAVVLLLGLSNMARGGSPHRSQKLMRLRVL